VGIAHKITTNRTIALAHVYSKASVAGKSLLDNARIFAQLNIALADAGIAAWDS
jgi:hypothetical protein